MDEVGDLIELRLSIVSDYVCPWCFLVSLRLAKALHELRLKYRSVLLVHVQWFPHFLLPLSHKTLDKRAMYTRKLGGSEAKVSQMESQFSTLLGEYGESYSVDGQVGSTLNAHRLAAWTREKKGEEAQWIVSHEIFRQYHSKGRNLAETETLVDAAACSNVFDTDEIEQVKAFLHSKEKDQQVLSTANALREELGLTLLSGVPHVKVETGNGMQFEIPGAQDVEYFVRIFETIIKRSNPQNEHSKL